ncbi:MAG TPA: DISARM system phospholipase D-like protein DrmC [Terriglobales bacterium]|nr:DISARM system phospholipase D-like protein DrmC [Terriglobales bacterium]
MKEFLLSLSPSDLRELASALKSGRLAPPYSFLAVQRFVSDGSAEQLASRLSDLADAGSSPAALAQTLELVASAVGEQSRVEDLVSIVTTGPEAPGLSSRDTSVVVGDLFRQAERSVILAGYAVYQGQKIFQDLAERMALVPGLHVRMYLDVQRAISDSSAPEELARRFAHRFKTQQWPAEKRLPEIYYDPRSTAVDQATCSALHAKCVVVDGRDVFISSANFTEAAQKRNIELGVLIHSVVVAGRVTTFFVRLVEAGYLKRLL